jgi:serine/threonine-protein kinase HipA
MTNIHLNKTAIGTLTREQTAGTATFTYAKGCTQNQTVSLLMPPTTTPWKMRLPGWIHPIFAMNLPEGPLRETIIRMFKNEIPNMDDLTLFTITGRSQIGRIRCHPNPGKIDTVKEIPLKSLLEIKGNTELHTHLLERFARYSGISGVQPKIMVRDSQTLAPPKTTAQGNTHILKFFDPKTYPALGQNEFLCLTAAQAASIEIPNFWLSNDTLRLIIERFDTNPDDTYMAFEDGCTLENLQPQEKYTGSYEQLAKTLKNNLTGENKRNGMEKLLKLIILSTIIRNGDAHRKNFGITYNTPKDTKMAPGFDIITTTPYIKNDKLALSLNGSKKWPNRKKLTSFGENFCNLTKQEVEIILEQTLDAVAQTRAEFKNARDQAPDKTAKETLNAILSEWETGLMSMQPKTIPVPDKHQDPPPKPFEPEI